MPLKYSENVWLVCRNKSGIKTWINNLSKRIKYKALAWEVLIMQLIIHDMFYISEMYL